MRTKLRSDIIYGLVVAALLLLFNIIYVSYSTGFVHEPEVVLETDHYRYIEMARGPGNYLRSGLAHEAPFSWRLLIPFLGFLLTRIGLNPNLAFYIITNIFLFLFLFTFYLYLKKTGFDIPYSLLGMILVGLTPGAVRWYEYQYWMTDPACLFCILLSFYLIETERDKYLLPLSVIAVTIREVYLIIFVYYFLYLLRKSGFPKALGRTLTMLIAPIIVLALIHHYIITSNTYNLLAMVKRISAFRLEMFWYNQFYLLTVGSFGIIFPLLLLFPRKLPGYGKKEYARLVFVVLVYAQLAVANNTDRLLIYALPVLLPAALWNLKKIISKTQLPPAPIITLIVAFQILFYAVTKFYRQAAISVFQPTNLTIVLVLSLFWLLCQAVLAFHHYRLLPSEGRHRL